MFSDKNLPEPLFITEIEKEVSLSLINEKDGLFFDNSFTSEKRIRTYVYQMLLTAKTFLPDGYFFKIYEAYRPLETQKKLWETVVAQQKVLHPNMDENSKEFIELCDTYCANPYKQGSGHQSGAAIDVSLCNKLGKDYFMGSMVREFSEKSDFDYMVPPEAKKNRLLLKEALEKAGFINYPSEWWHYSFGDRLWAKLTGSKIAIFGNLDV